MKPYLFSAIICAFAIVAVHAEEPLAIKELVTPVVGDLAEEDATAVSGPQLALRWLQSVQQDNGSWENSPAHTGLAILCYLEAGETPLSEEFGETVQEGMRWLATNAPKSGIWGGDDQKAVYHHGIATYALAESYGMTQVPFLNPPMERLVATIIEGQQPGGGWDYHFRDGKRWDLSVSAWQIFALKAAHASGSDHPKLVDSLARAGRFVRSTYSAGRFGYANKGVDPNGNLTGAAALALRMTGYRHTPECEASAKWILTNRLPPLLAAADNWQNGRGKLYGWQFDAKAMFATRGPIWNEWNQSYAQPLLANQHADGYWTFDTPVMGEIGGPTTRGKIIATCLTLRQLLMPRRWLPTFKSIHKTAPLDQFGEKDLQIE